MTQAPQFDRHSNHSYRIYIYFLLLSVKLLYWKYGPVSCISYYVVIWHFKSLIHWYFFITKNRFFYVVSVIETPNSTIDNIIIYIYSRCRFGWILPGSDLLEKLDPVKNKSNPGPTFEKKTTRIRPSKNSDPDPT